MSNCYKKIFPVKVNYSDSTIDTIYGKFDFLVREFWSLKHADSIGIKGSTAVFNRSIPKGDLNVDSYLIGDLSVYNNLKGSNDQAITIDFGTLSLSLRPA